MSSVKCSGARSSISPTPAPPAFTCFPPTGWPDSTGPTQFNNNLRLERPLGGTDVPQRLVVSYVVDLPMGQGHTFLGDVHGVAGKAASGWGLNGVSTFQRGFPLTLTTNV